MNANHCSSPFMETETYVNGKKLFPSTETKMEKF